MSTILVYKKKGEKMVKKIKISRQLNTCNGDVIATQLQHNHNILN